MATTKAKTKVKPKKKVRKDIGYGTAHIQSTFNNTIITITDQPGQRGLLDERRHGRVQGRPEGDAVRGPARRPRKRRNQARDFGVRYVDVRIKGPGAGRESAIRSLQSGGIEIRSIKDVTPDPPQRLPRPPAPPGLRRASHVAISRTHLPALPGREDEALPQRATSA